MEYVVRKRKQLLRIIETDDDAAIAKQPITRAEIIRRRKRRPIQSALRGVQPVGTR